MPPLLSFGPHIIPRKQYGFDATQDNPIGFDPHIVPQRNYGFGANQSKPHYSLGYSYLYVYRHLPPVEFNAELLSALKEVGDITSLKNLYSVTRQTLLQTNQDHQLAFRNSQVNMPNPSRRLLRISDSSITYLTKIIHNHQQHIRSEACAAAADTVTLYT